MWAVLALKLPGLSILPINAANHGIIIDLVNQHSNDHFSLANKCGVATSAKNRWDSLCTISRGGSEFVDRIEDESNSHLKYEKNEKRQKINLPPVTEGLEISQSFTDKGHDNVITNMSVAERRLEVKSLRQQAKILHDSGELEEAAYIFEEAANILDDILERHQREGNRSRRKKVEHPVKSTTILSGGQQDLQATKALTSFETEAIIDDMEMMDASVDVTPRVVNVETFVDLTSEDLKILAEEAATCHLHQALCHLKNKDAEECLLACTEVINDREDSYPGIAKDRKRAGFYHGILLSSAVKSRAYHRRAKSKLALNDLEGALSDARSAAFLGDRGAVALYGKLMRQESKTNSPFLEQEWNENDANNKRIEDISWVLGPEAASLTTSHTEVQSRKSPTNLQFMQFLNGATEGDPANASGASERENLFGSVISVLGKQLESKESQEKICSLVNNFGTPFSVTQVATMAGVPMNNGNAKRIAQFCSTLTPDKLEKGVSLAKRLVKMAKVCGKLVQVVSKLSNLVVYILLFAWVRRIASKT